MIEIEEAPHPAPRVTEVMGVTFGGFEFRLTFRGYEWGASLSCEVLTEGKWQEMAGYDLPENVMKFQRGIEWLHSYAYDHGARPEW